MKDKETDCENAPGARAFRLSISRSFPKMMLRENKSEANDFASYPFFDPRLSRSSAVQSLILHP
jgi:hypothetical protein